MICFKRSKIPNSIHIAIGLILLLVFCVLLIICASYKIYKDEKYQDYSKLL